MRLPLDCEAIYENGFLSVEESWEIYHHLINTYHINQSFLQMQLPDMVYTSDFGKISFTNEEYITKNRFPQHSYGKTFIWDEIMSTLKTKIESYANVQFGMCVCIYYPDGTSGVDFHSDYMAFGDLDMIPSISLGAKRNFQLRKKTSSQKHDILLDHGSMILMGENCQELYEHCLPLDPSCHKPRINLTFRKVDPLHQT